MIQKMLELNKIYNIDCLEGMKQIDNKSTNMILSDLPYGSTNCKWDNILPLEKLWQHYERIIKENGAIVLTSIQPFTTKLIMSNLKLFKYELIWFKNKPSGHLDANKRPLRIHENILVFYKKQPIYNPQKTKSEIVRTGWKTTGSNIYGKPKSKVFLNINKEKYPVDVLFFSHEKSRYISHKGKQNRHPTQKPVELFKYLIKTYTNKGDLVLDNCMGSGTTAIACKQLGRNFIGFDISKEYVKIANKRLEQEKLE